MSAMPISRCTTRWGTRSRTRCCCSMTSGAGSTTRWCQFSVNCYGRRVNAARGLRLPLAMKDEIRNLDPPSPNPHRCMQVGAATAKIMADSPWRVALMASSSWSHSFLTEKNWQLWPDVAADRALYDALEAGDYAKWHQYKTDQIEEFGPARGAELVLPAGRDGSARPQARQGRIPRMLGLCLAGGVRALPRVNLAGNRRSCVLRGLAARGTSG